MEKVHGSRCAKSWQWFSITLSLRESTERTCQQFSFCSKNITLEIQTSGKAHQPQLVQFSSGSSILVEWEFGDVRWFLWWEGNRRTRRRTLDARQKPATNRPGIKPGLFRMRALSSLHNPCPQQGAILNPKRTKHVFIIWRCLPVLPWLPSPSVLFKPQSWRPARTTSRKVSVTSRSTPAELTLTKPVEKINTSRCYLP